MRIVFGLGNPGFEYEHSRHNAGFDVVDKAAAFFQVKLKKRCFRNYASVQVPGGILVEPQTFMNNSGLSVPYFSGKTTDFSDFAVICDNIDLAVGGLRVRKGGGSSGQHGLESVASALGTNDFVRIYVGVGRPDEGVSVPDHVLSRETDDEKIKVYEQAIQDASRAVVRFLEGASIEELQREFNRKGIC